MLKHEYSDWIHHLVPFGRFPAQVILRDVLVILRRVSVYKRSAYGRAASHCLGSSIILIQSEEFRSGKDGGALSVAGGSSWAEALCGRGG